MDTLGPKNVLDYAKRFGFEEDFPPYLPIALGAGDATLLEVTSAYTVFPNQGVRMKPFEVLRVHGSRRQPARGEPGRAGRRHPRRHRLRDDQPAARRADSAAPAQRAASMASEWPLAGKTGTVDDNTDAWFIGFDPDITVGVWIGLDEKKSLGGQEQGALAALPIWMEFMKAYIDGRPDKDDAAGIRGAGQHRVPARWTSPPARVLPTETADGISEAFISGTQPGANAFPRAQ